MGLTDTAGDDHPADPITGAEFLQEDLGGDLEEDVEQEERSQTCERDGRGLSAQEERGAITGTRNRSGLTGVVDGIRHGDRLEKTSDTGVTDVATIEKGQEVGDGEGRQDPDLRRDRDASRQITTHI